MESSGFSSLRRKKRSDYKFQGIRLLPTKRNPETKPNQGEKRLTYKQINRHIWEKLINIS